MLAESDPTISKQHRFWETWNLNMRDPEHLAGAIYLSRISENNNKERNRSADIDPSSGPRRLIRR